MRTRTLRTLAVLVVVAVPGTLRAQANPVPQATAMAGNYTALARGIAAPAWNPAGLGMPDNPGLSFTFLPVNATAGLGPITTSDLADYEGQFVPRSIRSEWLASITEEGGQKGNVGADITYLAVGVGPVAFTASSSFRGRVNVAPDVAEILFFGNAGPDGGDVPGSYTLAGSNFDVAGTTTFAASAGFPLSVTLGPLPDQHFAVGATLKYTVGNFLILGQENGSAIESDPLSVTVAFPVIHSPFPDDSLDDQTWGDVINNGSGVGLDVGAAWQGGIFSAGVVVKNLINTFEWDLDNLELVEGSAIWDADTAATSFDEASIENAPQELIDRIESLYTFSPTLSAGAAAQVLPILKVTGDVRHSLDDNLELDARSHLGVGAELTAVPVLPIRAGLAVVSGGFQLSGGLGVRLGPVQLAFAAAYRDTDLGSAAVGHAGFTFGIR